MNTLKLQETTPGCRRQSRRLLEKILAAVTAAALTVALGMAGVMPAAADSAPPVAADPANPATVTADGLPTVQIDGVVWQQVIVGNTVYAAGSFGTARPAGSPAGTNTVVRRNILAYNLTTGELLPFAPVLNAQALSIAASPDGSRIYVGGDFTSVNGTAVWRVAALNPVTGALITSFRPRPAAAVRAIVPTADTVYLGGLFTAIGSVTRNRLAAVRAADGALTGWAPSADNGKVNALALSPDRSRIVVGGSFTTLNGSGNPGYGLAAVDTANGGLLPMAANSRVRNGGTNAAITALSGDADNVYATGYVFGGGGNLEGTVAAAWNGGAITWLEDCHGDSYAVYAAADAVYKAGHPHNCANIGGFPETSPRMFQRGVAFSKAKVGTIIPDSLGYPNWSGMPSPSPLNWYPHLNTGTFTGQSQGPWAVTGNNRYVVMGGEFTTVNGVLQQGLVRFTVRDGAPNRRGPVLSGLRINPTLTSPAAGTVRLRWQANHDQDNVRLTYRIFRDTNTTTPIKTITQDSTFWNRPGMSYLDSGLVPGQSYRYRIFVKDPLGNEVRSDFVSITAAASTPASGYADAVMADRPTNFWRFNDGSGTTRADFAGAGDLAAGSGAGLRPDGAVNGEATGAGTFNGTATGVAVDTGIQRGPDVFTAEAWVRTSTTAGGKIIGFGNVASGTSKVTDRNVYMDNTGSIHFGVWNGAIRTINSGAGLNDGQWHHVVSTLGSGGMALYIDGVRVAARTDVTTGRIFDGYWRIGSDLVGAWPSKPTSSSLKGDIDEVAIYPAALGLNQVQSHYRSSGRNLDVPPAPPTAAFTAAVNSLTVSTDASGSSDANGPISSYLWNFGDGTFKTGVKAQHAYAAPGTYTVRLTVKDGTGNTATASRSVTATAPPANQPPVAAFTSSVNQLTAAFNATGSSDTDGTVASYAWNFGDGTTGTGATASRTYRAAGTFQVSLTVTDDRGATGTKTQPVTVTAPAVNTVLAADAFERNATGGFGAADVGGAWAVTGGNSNFAVNNGAGRVTLGTAGSGRSASLGAVSTAAFDGRVTVSADKIANGGGMQTSLFGRRVNNNDYRAKIKVTSTGAVLLHLTKAVDNVVTNIAGPLTIPGLTVAANDPLVMRLKLDGTGPTVLSGKVWRASAAEPDAWQLSASDSTPALQTAGSSGLVLYLSGSTTNVPVVMSFDDFSIKTP